MVKTVKPTTPGRRGLVQLERDDLTSKKNRPLKSLLSTQKRSGGRNNQGHTTSEHIGGGHKKKYRKIDFKRLKDDIPASHLINTETVLRSTMQFHNSSPQLH